MPRARCRFTTASTFCTPWRCCVSPMAQQQMRRSALIAIEHSGDGGKGWRREIARFLKTELGCEVYDPAEGGEWSRPPAFPSAAGGLVSTVDDYFAFSRMLLHKGRHGRDQILSRAAVELMTADHLTPEQRAELMNPFVGALSASTEVRVLDASVERFAAAVATVLRALPADERAGQAAEAADDRRRRAGHRLLRRLGLQPHAVGRSELHRARQRLADVGHGVRGRGRAAAAR